MSQTSTKPQPRSARYMDFIPSAAQRPASRPAPQLSASRPAPQPSTSRRPAAQVTQKTVRRTQPVTPKTPKVVEEYLETTTIIYPNTPPKPQPAQPVVQSQPATTQTTQTTQATPLEPTETIQEKVEFGIIEDASPRQNSLASDGKSPLDAPDGNRYTLGGKSPFLVTADQVDKRPLSNHLPEGTASGVKSTKNIYSRREILKVDKRPAPIITDAKTKDRSGLGLAIAIVVTLALGALVGTLAYLAFFQ